MKFAEAIKLLKKGKKLTRPNWDFDYIRLGIEDWIDLSDKTSILNHGLTFWKKGKEKRQGELWMIDYIAEDWEEVK